MRISLAARIFVILAVVSICCPLVMAQEETQDQHPKDEHISKVIHVTKDSDEIKSRRERGGAPGEARTSRTSGNGISYHSGPIILGTTDAYFIWYGNWSGNTTTTILPEMAQTIGGSNYFNINTTYYNGAGTHVTNAVHYVGSTSVTQYPAGSTTYSKSLSDNDIQTIVTNVLNSGALPLDTNGVYFVLTSSDVNESSGFCSQYCGWHTNGTIKGSDVKFAFIGNPARCPSACEEQTTSPNGNAGADGMASIIAHELEESVTDPDGNAWYDSRGEENADKCAWTFGTEYSAANGSSYNIVLGGHEFLIQQNWVNASGGFCSMTH